MPKVESLQDRVPFSARGTLLPQRVTPAPTGHRAIQLKIQQKRDEVAWLQVLRDQYNKDNLKYDAKWIGTAKKPTSKPRSWQPEMKEHNNWRRERGLRRGRPKKGRLRVALNEDRRMEGKHLDGPGGNEG
jgi:hypothetical protein